MDRGLTAVLDRLTHHDHIGKIKSREMPWMGRLRGLTDKTGAILLAAYVIHEVKNAIDSCGSGMTFTQPAAQRCA